MESWLEAGGEAVAEAIRERFGRGGKRHPGERPFVYRTSLDAEGKLDDLSRSIQDWIGHGDNRLRPDAQFVYRAWLDATRNTVFVERPLGEWLALHGSAEDIDYVFSAWFEAGGRFGFIRERVLEWVRSNPLERNAVYLLKHLAKQRALPDDVTLKILDWCARFANDPDAIWRLNSLSAHISADLFAEAVRASEQVLAPIFANSELSTVTRSHVTTILGNLARLEHLASHPQSRELDALLCRWMDHPQSFEPAGRHAPYAQTRPFLLRLIAAAESAATTPELTPLIEWVGRWDDPTRSKCKDLIKALRALRHTSTGGRWRAKLSLSPPQ